MSDINVHQLAAAYALDALDERERAAFEAHYTECAICAPEVAGFRETLSQVGAAVAVHPPESLKADVMARVSATRQLSPLLPASVVDLATHRRRRQRLLRNLSVAAAAIVLAVGAFVMGRRSDDASGYAGAAAAIFAQPDTRISVLNGTGTGSFKIAWSPGDDRAVVIGNGLAEPDPGKAYELWRIDGAGAHAVHLLDKAADGRVRRVVEVDGSPAKWAVTVEPDAGVEVATGDIIFSATA
jgi:anti-sigma-K factor RskA